MDSGWREWYWDRYCVVAPQDQARVNANASLEPLAMIDSIAPEWEIAADDAQFMPSDDSHFESGSPQHRHTEFEIYGLRIHVDHLYARRNGPGSSYTEYRIFWNGALQGRGGRFGSSLGVGGSDLPARALLPNGQLLVVGKKNEPEISVWSSMPPDQIAEMHAERRRQSDAWRHQPKPTATNASPIAKKSKKRPL